MMKKGFPHGTHAKELLACQTAREPFLRILPILSPIFAFLWQ